MLCSCKKIAKSENFDPFPYANILLTMQWCLRRFRFPKGKQHCIFPLLAQHEIFHRFPFFSDLLSLRPAPPIKAVCPQKEPI